MGSNPTRASNLSLYGPKRSVTERSGDIVSFVLIDPFGFSGIPYNLISRLLSKNKYEVLITFVVDAINRWLTHADPQIRSHISETFGTDAAIAIAEGTGDRPTQLKNLYQQQLGKVAQFVRYFEMRDSNDREASVGGTQDTAKTPFRFFPVYTNVAPQF